MPTRTRNFFGRVVDGLLPGNNYDRNTGQFNHIASGIAGRGASVLGSLFLGPAAGALINKGVGNYINNGSILPTSGPLALNQGGAPTPYSGGPVDRMGIYNQGVHVNNIAMDPFQTGRPTEGTSSPVPNPGLPGGFSHGIFSGGAGNFGPPQSGSPNRQHYGNGAGPGTGYGTTSYTNDAWGDTAASFGLGALGVANGPSSYALSDALMGARLNRV